MVRGKYDSFSFGFMHQVDELLIFLQFYYEHLVNLDETKILEEVSNALKLRKMRNTS